jgi:hypothetical protein
MAFFGIPTRKDFDALTTWLGPAEDTYSDLLNSWGMRIDVMPIEVLRELVRLGAVVAEGQEEAARLFEKTGQNGDAYEARTSARDVTETVAAARELLADRLSAVPPSGYAAPPPTYQYPQSEPPPSTPPPTPPATHTDDPNDDWG